jgi:predicted TIM-barrel fold metal-dependent hydrolase
MAGGAAAFGLMASAPPALAQRVRPHRVDVHHHFLPPAYQEASPPTGEALGLIGWTPEKTLREMDDNGVAISMLSFPTPYLWFEGAEAGQQLARLCNEYCADLVGKHPSRFGLFAGIPPLDDTWGALQEIAYAYGTLKADGITVMTNYGGRYLGDVSFAPVLEELNRREAVVFVHPADAKCCMAVDDGAPTTAYLEFPIDTARTIMSLWTAEAVTKWPKIRFIFSHGGGALPMIADRIDKFGRPRGQGTPPAHDVAPFLQKLYFDTANAANPSALAGTMGIADPRRVLFGSDYPYVPIRRGVDDLARATMTGPERSAIERDNALLLMPQVQARLAA